MPARPSNIGGQSDILHVVNQSIRELNIRIDSIGKILPIHKVVSATATLNFGSIPPASTVERNIRVSGAKQVGAVSASPQLPVGPHLTWSSSVTGTDVVTVRLSNPTGSPIAANTVKWNAAVTQV